MATSSEVGILSELQRAAFDKWKCSEDYMELSSQLQLQQIQRASKGGKDTNYVNIALSVREDGKVDVLMMTSETSTLLNEEEQGKTKLPILPYQSEDLLKIFDVGANEDHLKKQVDLDKPQRLYLYFLELQRLKQAKDLELKATASSLPKGQQIVYDGGLSELQRAAFTRWSGDEEVNEIVTTNVEELNLKEDPSPQPTMGTFKEEADPNSVLELQPLLQKVVL